MIVVGALALAPAAAQAEEGEGGADPYAEIEVAAPPNENGPERAPHRQTAADVRAATAPEEPPRWRAKPSRWPPPEARWGAAGPALTVAGGAALVAGASVAAVGASTQTCTGEACNDRFRFLLGGGLTGALLGGLGMGIGLHLWTADLGEAPGYAHGPRASSAMMTGGIALVVAGTGALGVGFLGSFAGGYDRDDPPNARYGLPHPSQPILLVSGATLLAVGVPMLELGARRPLSRAAASGPEIHLGPSGVMLRGTL